MTTATTVTGTRAPGATTRIATSGMSAPTVNAKKEAHAACQGFVRASGSMPSSVSACAPRASCAVSWTATSWASSGLSPLSS